MKFVFNSAPNNFATGTYYAVVVTARPVVTNSVRSDLSEQLGSPVVILTGKVLTSTKLTFNDFFFPTFSWTQPIYGIVVIERIGANPASTDPLIFYSDFTNSLGQDFVGATGTFRIPIDFPSSGALQIKDVYQYNSGSYTNVGSNNNQQGLIYLIGTQNNTVSYANPVGSSKLSVIKGFDGSPYDSLFDRIVTSAGSIYDTTIGLDFKDGRIRVGSIAARCANIGGIEYSVQGSNNLPGGMILSNLANNELWTLLASSPYLSPNQWSNLISSDAISFWKYLRLTGNAWTNVGITEIEFFDSTIESTTLNMVP